MRNGILSPEEIIQKWQSDGDLFQKEAQSFHLYE